MKLKVIILLISLLSGSIEAQTIHYNASHTTIMNVPVRYSMPFHSNSIVWKRIYG